MTRPPQPSLIEGGSSNTLLAVDNVCIKISPPCAASKWEIVFPPLFLAISSITDLPFSKKLIKQDEGLLFTSTGVIRCIAVQFCISAALHPRGVHHFRVTVSYSDPSSNLLNVLIKAESWGFPTKHLYNCIYISYWIIYILKLIIKKTF